MSLNPAQAKQSRKNMVKDKFKQPLNIKTANPEEKLMKCSSFFCADNL